MSKTPFPTPWRKGRPSLFAFLKNERAAGAEFDSTSVLPDESKFAAGKRRWVSGGRDGVATHHAGSDPAIAERVFLLFKEALVERDQAALRQLYVSLCEDKTAVFFGHLLSMIRSDADIDRDALFDLAHFFTTEAPDRGPVKCAMAILGLKRNPGLHKFFIIFGLHEEFTLFAVTALENTLADATQDIWKIAESVRGWGRIQAVKRLARTTDPRIKAWMLRGGYRNSVMNEYLAFTCAQTGDLRSALQCADPDDALLSGACEILEALVFGQPGEPMEAYGDGAEATQLLMRHLIRRSSFSLSQLAAVRTIRSYVEDQDVDWVNLPGWNVEVRREISSATRAIVSRAD